MQFPDSVRAGSWIPGEGRSQVTENTLAPTVRELGVVESLPPSGWVTVGQHRTCCPLPGSSGSSTLRAVMASYAPCPSASHRPLAVSLWYHSTACLKPKWHRTHTALPLSPGSLTAGEKSIGFVGPDLFFNKLGLFSSYLVTFLPSLHILNSLLISSDILVEAMSG